MSLLSGCAGGDELLGLREEDADETDADGEAGATPEDFLPRGGRGADAETGARGEDVSEGVAVLEDAAHETTGVGTEGEC